MTKQEEIQKGLESLEEKTKAYQEFEAYQKRIGKYIFLAVTSAVITMIIFRALILNYYGF